MPGISENFMPSLAAPKARAGFGPRLGPFRAWLFLSVLAGMVPPLIVAAKADGGARHAPFSPARHAEACAPLIQTGAPGGAGAPRGAISRVLETLARSATARAVLRRVRGRRVQVCLDKKTPLLAYYFSSTGVIGLSTELSEGGRVAFLAHELSHVPQHPRYSDNRYFPPGDLLLLRRIREASAEAISTRIAWELREAGYPAAWIEKGAGPYADVVRAFHYAAEGDASARGLQAATRAAFDYWFTAGWRRDVYDRMTAEHLRRISHDRTGLVPPRKKLRADFLTGIAALGGGNFLAETQGPALTDGFYAGQVSRRIAARIDGLLRAADLAILPAGGGGGEGPSG